MGTPSLYLTWLRPAVFAAGLWGEPGSAQAKDYGSLGGQIDLNFAILHRYDMTLSVGYAAGFQGSRYSGNEWMISLKIM
jgi:hypothetical protein